MERDSISIGQLMGLAIGGMIAPLTQWMTQSTTVLGGSGAWLSGVVVFLPLMLLIQVVIRLFGAEGQRESLGQLFERALGRYLGKGLTAVTLAWCLFQIVVGVRQYGDRLLLVGYPSDGLNFYFAVMLGLVVWITWGKLVAFARAGDVFFLVSLLFLVGMLALTLYNIDLAYALPVWVEDALPITQSAVPLLGVAAVAVLATAVGDKVRCTAADRGRLLWSGVVFCGLTTAIQLSVVGQFGATLAREVEDLFFQMVAGIGVNGAFQRLEALMGGLWVLSDVMFLGLLGWICRGLAKALFHLEEKREPWVATVLVALAFGIAVFVVTDYRRVALMARGAVLYGNIGVAFGLFPLILLISKAKKGEFVQIKRKMNKKQKRC